MSKQILFIFWNLVPAVCALLLIIILTYINLFDKDLRGFIAFSGAAVIVIGAISSGIVIFSEKTYMFWRVGAGIGLLCFLLLFLPYIGFIPHLIG